MARKSSVTSKKSSIKRPWHHHVHHHVRRITEQWRTPHIVIAVLIVLGLSLLGFLYAEANRSPEVSSLGDPRDYSQDSTNPAPSPTGFAVSLGSATVDPATSLGCSGEHNFVFPVTSNGAGTVTFKRQRSDGTIIDAEPKTLSFSKAETKSIPYQWQLSPSNEFKGYAYLQVISPRPLTSNFASFAFTYQCR